DAYETGLLRHVVCSNDLEKLENKIIETSFHYSNGYAVTELINTFPKPSLASTFNKNEIHKHFNKNTLREILESLSHCLNPLCKSILNDLEKRSPMSLAITFEQFMRSKKMNFDEIIQQDFILAQHFLAAPDFLEGIRAAVIDKDKSPHWKPKILAKIT